MKNKKTSTKFNYFDTCPIIKNSIPIIVLCNEHTIPIDKCKKTFAPYNAFYWNAPNAVDYSLKLISSAIKNHNEIIFIKPIFKYVPNIDNNTLYYNDVNKNKLFWNDGIRLVKFDNYFEYIIRLDMSTLDKLCNIINDHPNWFLWETLNKLYKDGHLLSKQQYLEHRKPTICTKL